MWTWVSEDREEVERMLGDVLAPLLRRRADELRGRVCVGSAGAARSSSLGTRRPAATGYSFGRLGDEPDQIERVAERVIPRIHE